MSTTRRGVTHSRWWLPAVSLVLGAVMFAAFAIGGEPGDGAQAFAVMDALAALFASAPRAARRSAGSAAPAATNAGR
jgi:hypothetical protein